MGAATLVGRLGPVAAAVGVGVVMLTGGCGPAAADRGGDASSSTAEDDAGSAAPTPTGPRRRGPASRQAGRPAPDARPAHDHEVPIEPRRPTAVAPPAAAGAPEPAPESTPVKAFTPPTYSALPSDPAPGVAAQWAAPPAVETPPARPAAQPALAQIPPSSIRPAVPVSARASAEPGTAPPGGLGSVWAPWSASDPAAPSASAVSWLVLGAARRQLGTAKAAIRPAAVVSTGQVVAPPATALPAAVTNAPPVITNVVLSTPNSVTGAVIGTVTASDPNADAISYRAFTSTRGVVTISTAGVFAYTPTATARHAAARIGATTAATTDLVTVTVTDARGAAVSRAVSVPVSPKNAVPTATKTVGAANLSTGVVTGAVTGADADRDPLTYAIATNPAKGAVVLTAAGAFTYTPSAAARHAAARIGATTAARTDSFAVRVADGYGGAVIVPVNVAVAPTNTAPTATVSIGKPDPVTGIAAGRVSASDADRDALSFRASTPAYGSVAMRADGGFTYTPTAAARAAARASATPRTDTFTVTVTDGYGGSKALGVTATIAPADSAPRAGTATVGTANPGTGVVTGTVSATDPDGDAITYTAAATATPKGGTVSVATGGAFTYTPTATARHAAARTGAVAADKADTVSVAATDRYGARTVIPVSVPISPKNTAPVAAAPVVGTPNAGTGVVTGRVSATDADGDPLTYSTPATTAKGAVSLTATGAFTYTPTALARQKAAATGASAADRTDRFTVSIADGYGGTVAVPVTVAVSPAANPGTRLAAFPGAEGFGAYATGGRGGSVIYVTNLNANGPGSLQWAIDQPGARYILFKVSGVIDSQIHLTNGNVTIAGQTSPGGITVRGFVTDETPYQDQAVQAPADFAENWILQHIRIRPGADGPSDDGLRMRYTRNAIVDHVSIGNATDEAIEISYSHDITVQNTLIAETVGGHSFYGGVLMNYSNPAYGFGLDNVSLHHNVFNRIEGRLPEGSRESLAAANSYMNLEMSNNLYWDPNFFVALGLTTNSLTDANGNPYPIYWNLNAVNNYFRTRSDFPYGMFDDQILRTPRNNLYVSGNKMNLYPAWSDYQLFYCCNDFQSVTGPADSAQQAHRLATRNPFPAITYTATEQLVNLLLNTAGAWPRDPMDRRLMRSVAANTIATAPRDTNPAGDALLPAFTGAAPVAPADTDNDGMPDAWEAARGLNPNVANTNAHTLSSAGYTDLDVYLNELSASRVTGWVG